jgi:hypothetical protein
VWRGCRDTAMNKSHDDQGEQWRMMSVPRGGGDVSPMMLFGTKKVLSNCDLNPKSI